MSKVTSSSDQLWVQSLSITVPTHRVAPPRRGWAMALSSSSSNPSCPTIPKLSAVQSTCQPPTPRRFALCVPLLFCLVFLMYFQGKSHSVGTHNYLLRLLDSLCWYWAEARETWSVDSFFCKTLCVGVRMLSGLLE